MAEDVEIVEEGQQAPPVEGEEFGIEIIDETKPEDSKELGLQARIAELEAQNASLSSAPPQEAQASAETLALAQILKDMQKKPEEKVEEKGKPLDINAMIEDANKTFYNDPARATLSVVTPLLQQVQAQNQADSAAKDIQISKLTVLQDEGLKEVMGKYREEVEATVKADGVQNSTVYQRAVEKVRAAHFNDIMEEMVQAKVEAMVNEATAKVKPAVPFSNSTLPPTGGSAEQSAGTKLQIPRAVWTQMQQFALVKGADLDNEGQREAIVDIFKKRGLIK